MASEGGEVICCGRRQSREEVLADARRLAAGLEAAGLRAGDCVAILMRNDIPFITATMAAAMLNLTAVPVNWHFSAPEVDYILRDSEAKAVIAHADLWRGVADGLETAGLTVIVAETPDDLGEICRIGPERRSVPENVEEWSAFLAAHEPWEGEIPPPLPAMIYTSGTTGNPKGVRRLGPAKPSRSGYGHIFTPDVCMIQPSPAYHAAPNRFATMAFQVGGRLVMMPRFDPVMLLELIERHRVTAGFMVPTMFHRLLRLPDEARARYDVSSVSDIVIAGAPCPPDVKRDMLEWWGPVIYEFYGSTETSALTWATPEDAAKKPGTVGRAVETATVKVFDAEGRECSPGVEGEVYGRLVDYPDFTYHKRPEARAEVEHEGLITSGDIGWFDEDGYLFLSDRIKDMIISGGVNIYPAHIEAEILKFPDVMDCAVFGAPDADLGECVAAAIQMRSGVALDQTALRAFLAERIAKYMVPSIIVDDPDLPRQDTGKIFKRKLRDRYWEALGRRI